MAPLDVAAQPLRSSGAAASPDGSAGGEPALSSRRHRVLCGGRLTVVEAVLAVVLVAAAAAIAALAASLHRVSHETRLDPACVHALGGGRVRSNGGFDSSGAPAHCAAQLKAYASSGAYHEEVGLAVESAMRALNLTEPAGGNAQPQQQRQPQAAGQVAGRRRTLLGRALEPAGTPEDGQQQLGGPVAAAPLEPARAAAPEQRRLVVFDIDETCLSNLEEVLHPDKWSWDAWVAAARAPALQPTLRLYQALCAHGFAVAFVTGRQESSREATARNLEAAGYGRPCAEAAAGATSSSSSSSSSSSAACCYEALYLRQPGETGLASVYKPRARAQLLRGGNYSLTALVGDQYSDLNGEHAAEYAFKLPNVFYYIL